MTRLRPLNGWLDPWIDPLALGVGVVLSAVVLCWNWPRRPPTPVVAPVPAPAPPREPTPADPRDRDPSRRIDPDTAAAFGRWQTWFESDHKPHCDECQRAFDRMENAMCVAAFERLQAELRRPAAKESP